MRLAQHAILVNKRPAGCDRCAGKCGICDRDPLLEVNIGTIRPNAADGSVAYPIDGEKVAAALGDGKQIQAAAIIARENLKYGFPGRIPYSRHANGWSLRSIHRRRRENEARI